MNIHWLKRALRGRGDGFTLTAQLVQSKWINGKSVPRCIATLGSVRRYNWPDSDFHRRIELAVRGMFWKTVSDKLDKLDLNSYRKKIEKSIAKRVPPMNKKQWAAWYQRRRELGIYEQTEDGSRTASGT